MKVIKGVTYGIVLVCGVGLIVYENKQDRKVLDENKVIMSDIGILDYNLNNLYDNIVKMNELNSLDSEENQDNNLSEYSISKSSLLEDDFKRCRFDILNFWVETYKKDKLYYDDEPETEVEESVNTYYLESDGDIEEIAINGDESSESYEILDGAESISSEEASSEVEPDLEKTFIIISVSKYYNSDTTSNICYEIFNGTESLGTTKDNITLRNLKLDSGYSNSRIDLLELDGAFDISQLTYQVSLSNGENTISLDGLKEIKLTDNKDTDDYNVININENNIVFIKKEPIIGSNRIEIIENIRESIVSNDEVKNNGESVDSTHDTSEISDIANRITQRSRKNNKPERIVKIKETDELYTLSYSFDCWGPANVLKDLNNSSIQVVDNQNTDVSVDYIKNIQCKFNDSKYNIDADNKFLEVDFSINIQILRSEINKYLKENNQKEIDNNTINTFKNGFDSKFSLRLSNDTINVLLKLK